MSVFSIVTEKVKSVAEEVSNLSSSSSSVVNSISGYDTSNEHNFDFDSAKAAIEHNVEGMKTKVNNTSVLLDAVVSTHTSLQDSVSDNSSSGSSNSGSYSYSSSGNYSSSGSRGSSSSGGYYNSSSSSNSLLSNTGSTGKAIYGDMTKTSMDLTSLAGISNNISSIESVLQDNPSAYQKLLEELGNVKSTVGNAESTLNKELEVILSSNGIKINTIDGLLVEAFNKPLLVIEALSNTPGIENYVKDAVEVGAKHNIEVRYFSLDNIINTSISTTLAEEITDNYLEVESPVLDEKIINESNEVGELLVNETENLIDSTSVKEEIINEDETEEQPVILPINNPIKENKEESTSTTGPIIINNMDNKKNEENKNQPVTFEKDEDDSEEQKEIIITGTVNSITKEDEENAINKDNIKDEVQYNRLINIPTKENVKYNVMNSPVTIILKGNLILNAANGILTKEKLEEFIKTSGIVAANTIN